MGPIKKGVNHFINDSELENFDGIALVDKQFKQTVLTHIIANYNPSLKMPLFLAIYGNPGEGKTFQTMQICREFGIKVCYFSGAELSGNYERDSIIDIEDNYRRACNYYYGDEKIPCVIIIDDFHLSPASTKSSIGTTVNSQLLTGFLMNLCDKARNTPNFRVPIILLGNTFENVYEPLKRDGRMDFFHWKTSDELKRKIINNLFNDCLSKKDLSKLDFFIESYKDKSISFFAELKNDIAKKEIMKNINSNKNMNINEYLYKCNLSKDNKIAIDDLFALADKRIKLYIDSSL